MPKSCLYFWTKNKLNKCLVPSKWGHLENQFFNSAFVSLWFPRDCITHQLRKLSQRFPRRLQKVQWMNFHQLDGIAENTSCTISKEMIILLLGFSPWSELMERTMSFASWLLPKQPSGLLGGVASCAGPFPASETPGLAPLCPGLRARWLPA